MASGPKIFLCIHYQVQEWYQVPGNSYINGAIMFIHKWCQVHVYGTSMFLIHGMRCQDASIYMVPGCFYIHGARPRHKYELLVLYRSRILTTSFPAPQGSDW